MLLLTVRRRSCTLSNDFPASLSQRRARPSADDGNTNPEVGEHGRLSRSQ